jgi:integrase
VKKEMREKLRNMTDDHQVLVVVNHDREIAIRNAIILWAASCTDANSGRRDDLLRDKQRDVWSFFLFAKKSPPDVTPTDVKGWQHSLEEQGLRPNSIYVRTSFLSSFFVWAMGDPQLGSLIRSNPVLLARPRAPKAYQTESVKSLSDEELQALLSVVQRKALAGELVAKRDYAILLFFIATGMRRAEVLSLRGKDIRLEETLIITSRVKGGNYVGREIADPMVKEALIDYLSAAKRLYVFKTDAPIWTRHDRAGAAGEPLSSHCYARNLKRYATAAGIEHFHLHQTRHTFARIVAEETGSISATQDALEHKNLSTTRVYVQRIAVKRDLHSGRVIRRARRQNKLS